MKQPRSPLHGLRVVVARDRGEPMERLLALLGTGERALGEARRPDGRRRDFVLGRLAAREAIRRALGVSRPRHDPEILTARDGEPVVHGGGPLRRVSVSVTHAKGLAAACAWRTAAFSVGIDLERIRPSEVSASAYAFSRRERRLLLRLGDSRVAGLAGWAVKEASWKALALAPLDGPESLEIFSLDLSAGRAVVRVTPHSRRRRRPRYACARVGRIRAPDEEYVFALAWTVDTALVPEFN
jgi:4'-phosphopantetheinyl transferase EntD